MRPGRRAFRSRLPEDDSIVWLETEPGNPMTLDEFDWAQGEGVVGWLAETEPYEARTYEGDEGAPPNSEIAPEPQASNTTGGLFVVGEVGGQLVLSTLEFPDDDDDVWLEFQRSRVMTLEAFDSSHGEGVVGWFAEPEPY